MFFRKRCKECSAKDELIGALHREAAALQEKCHIHKNSQAFMARQAEMLRRDHPELWDQYFSRKAKRFRSSKELKADIRKSEIT